MIKLGLAVESMANHTTDEGWQIFKGLQLSGYTLAGYNLPDPEIDVSRLLLRYNPDIVVIQDKREWEYRKGDFREPRAAFANYHCLNNYDGFKVTILKDAHQRPDYHRQAAEQMGINCHIIYYDEQVVRSQASWLGPVIRTWHTIDSDIVPPYQDRHRKAVITGAVSKCYPLRKRIAEERFSIPEMDYLLHPGYHRQMCYTPSYLQQLSQYRISICTCSIYKYALRKIIESTACGCRVVTNLPAKYSPPGLETNLFRIDDTITIPQLRDVIITLDRYYNPEHQQEVAKRCKELYDYRVVTKKLAEDIDVAASHVL